MDDVRLPDLEVIRRFSIAVRREHAPAEEVIAALRADLAKLSGSARREAAPEASAPARATRSTPARTPARPARKPARKPTRRR